MGVLTAAAILALFRYAHYARHADVTELRGIRDAMALAEERGAWKEAEEAEFRRQIDSLADKSKEYDAQEMARYLLLKAHWALHAKGGDAAEAARLLREALTLDPKVGLDSWARRDADELIRRGAAGPELRDLLPK
jgi:hypothetical protein